MAQTLTELLDLTAGPADSPVEYVIGGQTLAPQAREQAAQMLALGLSELATNAIKFGAFAGDDGEVDVQWRLTGAGAERRLRLEARDPAGAWTPFFETAISVDDSAQLLAPPAPFSAALHESMLGVLKLHSQRPEAGWPALADEIVSVTISGKKGDTVVEIDEAPRRDTSLESLAKRSSRAEALAVRPALSC